MKPIPRKFNGKIVPEVIERVGFDKMFEMIQVNAEVATCYAGGITVCNEHSSNCRKCLINENNKENLQKLKDYVMSEELTFPREMITREGKRVKVFGILDTFKELCSIQYLDSMTPYTGLVQLNTLSELPTPKKKRLANRNEWLKWSASCNLGDDVWVVLHSNLIPTGAIGCNPSAVNYGDTGFYWRSKLDESGKPIQWEQFWIEE